MQYPTSMRVLARGRYLVGLSLVLAFACAGPTPSGQTGGSGGAGAGGVGGKGGLDGSSTGGSGGSGGAGGGSNTGGGNGSGGMGGSSNTGGNSSGGSGGSSNTGGSAAAGGATGTGGFGGGGTGGGGASGGGTGGNGGSGAGGKSPTGGAGGGPGGAGGGSGGATTGTGGGTGTGGAAGATGGSGGGIAGTTGTGGMATGGTSASGYYGYLPDPSSQNASKADPKAWWTSWKGTYYQDCGNGSARIASNGNETVSEGIGYGMLMAVDNGDQSVFENLWAYYKAHEDANGLMNWKINGCDSGYTGHYAAADADEDVAMALVQADAKWGGFKTERDSAHQCHQEVRDRGGTTVLLASGRRSGWLVRGYRGPVLLRPGLLARVGDLRW